MHQDWPRTIRTYEDLLKSEPELLKSINAIPNGGQLYLIHPLMLFAEIGIELSSEVQSEFAAQHGGAGSWSEGPYKALRRSTSEQPSQVTLRGLFRKSS